MDTLTHALLGGLAVRASRSGTKPDNGVSTGTATLIGALAAAFPDSDYLSFWIAPLTFLADWHRGPTHSLLMAPLWALLLGVGFARLWRKPQRWLYFSAISLLALLSHIASDLITAYGTQILWPLSDIRIAFGTTFVVDPWFSGLVVLSLVASALVSRPAIGARLGLLALVGYLGFQLYLQQQAMAIGESYVRDRELTGSSIYALPQPLSPYNWSIIVSDGQHHHVGLVNMAYSEGLLRLSGRLGWIDGLWSAYAAPSDLRWQTHSLFGVLDRQQEMIRQAWQQTDFAPFRHFAKFPVLYRVDRQDQQVCVWFTDLRYVLPGLTPPFRYGMCRNDLDEAWQLYRLRRFTANQRQRLSE
jgi:inner membrane protein